MLSSPLQQREVNFRKDFWDRYWGRADQLLVNFSPISRNLPRSLCERLFGPVSSFLKWRICGTGVVQVDLCSPLSHNLNLNPLTPIFKSPNFVSHDAVRLFLTRGQRFQSHLKYWTIKAGSELACVASVSAPVNRDL